MITLILATLTAVAPPDDQPVTLKGTVTYGAKAPIRIPKIQMPEECLKCYPDEPPRSDRLVVDRKTKALKWAFVYVKEGVTGGYPVPKEPVVLDQKGCVYTPHVFGVRRGQVVRAVNSDTMLHNVHYVPFLNDESNESTQPGTSTERTLDKVETMVPIKCDVHPWMLAWAGVLDHPFFAVTGADGTFEIRGLPPGKYTVAAWHEATGEAVRTVEVKADATVDFSLKPGEK